MPFNNYVDKMKGEGGGGQKIFVFVQAQGKKTVHPGEEGRGGQKMAKLCPRS